MGEISAAFHQNGLLCRFPDPQLQLLSSHARLVNVKRAEHLIMEGEVITSVYFPLTAVCAVSVADFDGSLTETAIFGREGCSDLVLDPGHDVAPLRTTVQVTGDAIRLPAKPYADVLRHCSDALAIVMRYQQVMITQLAYTSACRVMLPVVGRVARWLLMYQDRIGNLIPIVQEDLASALGVQRTYLSQALRRLEELGHVHTARGRIHILSRDGLMQICRGSYGPAEAEYDRVLGSEGQAK